MDKFIYVIKVILLGILLCVSFILMMLVTGLQYAFTELAKWFDIVDIDYTSVWYRKIRDMFMELRKTSVMKED